MKVSELIEKLQKAPPDMEVETEGCDCTGDVARVVLDEGKVMLCRSDPVIDLYKDAEAL